MNVGSWYAVDIFLIQSTCTPVNDRLRRRYPDRCICALPQENQLGTSHYGYATRQKTKGRDPITKAGGQSDHRCR